MSRAALLFTLACSHLARPVLAHGWLTGLVHEGKYTEGWFAYASGDYSKIPSVTRAFFSDSPVEDVTDPAIACNFRTRSDQKAAGNVPAKLHMSVSAGRVRRARSGIGARAMKGRTGY